MERLGRFSVSRLPVFCVGLLVQRMERELLVGMEEGEGHEHETKMARGRLSALWEPSQGRVLRYFSPR